MPVEITKNGANNTAAPQDSVIQITAGSMEPLQPFLHFIVTDGIEGKSNAARQNRRQQQIRLIRN